MNTSLKNISIERYLYIFIGLHLMLWTFVPMLVRYNLPLDSIEGTIWGHQLEWGYDKNPFLNGWLTALATQLGGSSGWMVYLFSQLSVAICFWTIWQLGKHILTPVYAFIAVVILESVQYFNFHAIDFNDNTLELSLWALTSYFFYKALCATTQRSTALAWINTGLFAALGMMAKYYTAALLTAMALFLFIHKRNRQQLTTLPPYLGLCVFLLVIIPHIIWLCFHDFITVQYVFDRASSPPQWTNHIVFPLQFAWQQLQTFLPALLLFAILFIGKKPRITSPRYSVTSFDKQFLFYVGVGPFLLTILLSVFFGIKLRAGWGMPLLSLWGILLLTAIQPTLSKPKFYCFLATIFILMGALLSGYSFSLIDSPDPSSANFPGKQIAQTITQQWHEKYHSKLDYVGGSRWVGGNIGFYSPDHPAIYIEWSTKKAPWINLEALRKKGAVFVWNITDNEVLPREIKQQFPHLQQATLLQFSWKRNTRNLPPIQIGIAWLPPTSHAAAR